MGWPGYDLAAVERLRRQQTPFTDICRRCGAAIREDALREGKMTWTDGQWIACDKVKAAVHLGLHEPEIRLDRVDEAIAELKRIAGS